jgi:hypothetical protein
MILGRSGPGVLDSIVAQARNQSVPIQNDMRLDPVLGPEALARAFGLNCDTTPDLLSGEGLASRLNRGPCGLMGQQTSGKHAVACHGVAGEDLAAASTSIILGVDPRGFTAINMDLWSFQHQFTINFILYR